MHFSLIDLFQKLKKINNKKYYNQRFSFIGHGSVVGVGRANNANNVGNANNVNGLAAPYCEKRSVIIDIKIKINNYYNHSNMINIKLNLANITKWQNTELKIVIDVSNPGD